MTYKELLQFKGTFYNDNDTHAGVEWYVEEKKDICIIRIIGTNDIVDWITNFIFFPIRHYRLKAKVHSGWYKEYVKSLIHIKTAELIKEKNYKKIIIMAHSKGCATAIFLTRYLADILENDINIETYLLASPKVGNLKFKKSIKKYNNIFIHNIQVKGDAVCKLPSNILLLFIWPYLFISSFILHKQFNFCFFWHVGKIRKIGKDNILTFKDHGFQNYKKFLISEEENE